MRLTSGKIFAEAAAPTFAFFAWGGWAFYSNSAHGFIAGLKAGILQGLASFIITLFLRFSVLRLRHMFRRKSLRAFAPPLITVMMTGSGLFGLHYALHTPEIAKTIGPPIAVAASYCFYLSFTFTEQS